MNSEIGTGGSVILLLGSEKSAILNSLLSHGEHIIGVVLPHSVKREERYEKLKKICSEHKISIYRPKKSELSELLGKLSADLLISAGFPYLLSADDLQKSKININIHPTLLPKYRGPATAWHVISDGNTESGVTIHFIDEGMDTGDIIHQETIQLSSFDTVNSLMRKTSESEPVALEKALVKLRQPDFLPLKQDETRASAFPGLRIPEDSMIDPKKSITELYNFIRACDPDKFPAFFIKDGERVGIKIFRMNRPPNEPDSL